MKGEIGGRKTLKSWSWKINWRGEVWETGMVDEKETGGLASKKYVTGKNKKIGVRDRKAAKKWEDGIVGGKETQVTWVKKV